MEKTTILLQSVQYADLAQIFGLASGTVRRLESSQPWRLPPFIKIGRKKFYLLETVKNWLIEKQQQPPSAPVIDFPLAVPKPQHQREGVKRGRGRPRHLPPVSSVGRQA